MSVSYTLKPVDPHAHLFEVVLQATELDPSGQLFELPNWIPGSYMIRDFSKNIISVDASSNGEPVGLEKISKSSWQSPKGLSSIRLVYRVYAWDLSVRSAHLDNEHGFFNGTSVFMSVAGQENQPLQLQLLAPDGESFKRWRVASTLTAVHVDEAGFGEYSAIDYDELIDHPVEMGTFERIEFDACGVPHEIILTGEYHTDNDRLVRDLKTICEAEIEFFGKPAPVERYVFLVMVVGEGYGGLEHRASTALLVTRDHLPIPGDDSVSDKYMSFLGLCSHEYFHTWNVKRIKPAAFIPFELAQESYTNLLWFFEGITSYYDDLFLVRSGLISTEQYFDLMAKTITRIQRGSGRLVQSVTDSSFDAWNKFYKQDANAPNAIVSYYAKGALVSLCLDAEIRKATNNEKSLDDLMRLIWSRWLETGNGLQEREPEQLASEIAGSDLSAFFERALYSTEELPVADSLNYLGVDLHWRTRKSVSDVGGGRVAGAVPVQSQRSAGEDVGVTTSNSKPVFAEKNVAPWIGANLDGGAGRVSVTHVFQGGAAEQAGLAPGDTLIAINDLIVSAADVPGLLERHASTDSLVLHYSRHGVLRQTSLLVSSAVADTCSLTRNSNQQSLWPVVEDSVVTDS